VSSSPPGVEKTLPMTVANTGFMLDRLGQDCAPLQFLRELTQNGIEAVLRTPEGTGEIVWDVDWNTFTLSEIYKLCVIDTGTGMTGEEMVRYINQLSSSVQQQSHAGNFGVGAKIAAATRNHEGLIYLSWRDGIGSMIHLWRDPVTGEYGLRQFERPDGTYGHWAIVSDDVKPKQIKDRGTMVVLLGNSTDDDTMRPPEGAASPSRWIGRYLNSRYFRFPAGIVVRAREGWENPRSDADRNLLRTIVGQERYLREHSTASGRVDLTNATVHWWILKDENALTQNSGWIASSGHVAALYQDELYDMATGRSGVARLQLFGVIFGYQRVVLYVEPALDNGNEVVSNTARTALIMNGEPLPWADWAAEFREKMPDEINALMDEVTRGSTSSDHKQAIRERLRQIKDLLRVSKYRPTPSGSLQVDDSVLTVGGKESERQDETRSSSKNKGGNPGGRVGNIYALFLSDQGVPAEPVFPDSEPTVQWVSVTDGTRTTGFLEDRAAKYLVEQNLLQINADFRVFTDMIERWAARYSDAPGGKGPVKDVVQEWFEQTLIETVLGVQSLKDGREWTLDDIAKSLSEEALTSAVMPRYHVDVAVKRTLGAKLGSLKEKAS
jgi:hypothetical protein